MPLPHWLASRPGRLAAFFFLYVTEGIPLGFTATAIATQMRREGLSPAQISVFVGTLYLPWSWKWLIGPFVDVFHWDRLGRRRGWILAAQVGLSLALLALMPIDYGSQWRLFTLVVLVANFFGATQDVAIDALACSVLSERERGLANGLMFAGAYTGQAVGGAGVLWLAGYVGLQPTYLVVAGAVLAVTLFVVLPLGEPRSGPAERPAGPRLRAALGAVVQYAHAAGRALVGTRQAVVGLAFALLPAGAYAMSLALQSTLAVELGLTDDEISLLALISTVISAIGCVVGGWLSDLLGRRRMLAIYLIGTALATLYLAHAMQQHGWVEPVDPRLPDRPQPAPALLIVFWQANIVYAIFQGLMYGTRTALFMDLCTPAVAATQFTAYMALLNLVIWYSGLWQGFAAEAWGYPTTLAVDALAGLVGIVLLPLMASRRPAPST